MKYLVLLATASLAAVASFAQTTLFSDNFDRATLNGGVYAYATTPGSADGGASIISNILVLTNDATGATTGNVAGRTFVTVPFTSFAAPFSTTLGSNTGTLTWSFNMRTSRTSLSGFDNSNYGIAVVLAGTSSDLTTGNGYAVVIGNGVTPDPVRLVRFSGGMDANNNLTNVITGIAPVSDIASAQHLSVSVSYNPTNNTWSMAARNDGASFVAPASGTLTDVGSAIDSTYTASAMTSMGFAWAYSTGSNTASFDNVTVTTSASAVPEPSTYAALAGALALAGVIVHRRRRAA